MSDFWNLDNLWRKQAPQATPAPQATTPAQAQSKPTATASPAKKRLTSEQARELGRRGGLKRAANQKAIAETTPAQALAAKEKPLQP